MRRPPKSTRTDTLSLHDALPIFVPSRSASHRTGPPRERVRPLGAILPEDSAQSAHLDLRDPYPIRISKNLRWRQRRSEEHTSELQSLMRISYAVFCL